MSSKESIFWSYCNKCGRQTRHDIHYEFERSASDELAEGFSVDWWDKYELLECRGCEQVVLKHSHSFSENCEPDGRPRVEEVYYPPSEIRRRPVWFDELSGDAEPDSVKEYVCELIKEIYACLHSEAIRLAAMGIRSMIEHVIIDLVDDNGSFSANLTALEENGYVSKKQKETIELALEIGHATMHRSYNPNAGIIISALDVAEMLIENVYVIPEKSKCLKGDIPPRRRRKK